MNNFELIEDYLTHQLGEKEKAAFEQQMASDPTLKADVELQKNIIDGVRKARMLDLKTMLNQIPVSGSTGSFTAGKIAATLITAGIITTGMYFYLKSKGPKPAAPVKLESPSEKPPVVNEKEKVTPQEQIPQSNDQPADIKSNDQKSNTSHDKKIQEKSAPAQPKIEVVDPSDELVNNSPKDVTAGEGQKSSVEVSHIAVDIESSNKKYNFHYQFFNSKLMLYGTFDKSLYEILEINGEHKTVFLFYKGNYYLLDEKQNNISPLEPIKDASLLGKLREYRGR